MGRMGLMWGQFMGAGLIRIAASLVLVALLGIVGVGAFRRAQVALPEVGKMLSGNDNLAEALAGMGPAAGVLAVVLTALQQAMKILGNPLKTSLRKYLRRPDSHRGRRSSISSIATSSAPSTRSLATSASSCSSTTSIAATCRAPPT